MNLGIKITCEMIQGEHQEQHVIGYLCCVWMHLGQDMAIWFQLNQCCVMVSVFFPLPFLFQRGSMNRVRIPSWFFQGIKQKEASSMGAPGICAKGRVGCVYYDVLHLMLLLWYDFLNALMHAGILFPLHLFFISFFC